MKTFNLIFLSIVSMLAVACSADGSDEDFSGYTAIPFRGNTFVTAAAGTDFYTAATSTIGTQSGALRTWDGSTVLSFFVRTAVSGELTLAVKAAATSDGTATLHFTDGESSYDVKIKGRTEAGYKVGTFTAASAGYKKIDITASGLKPGAKYPRISTFLLDGPAMGGAPCYLPESEVEDQEYWCRRGPSVHFFYTLPEGDVEWFYNEATVPEGSDIPGSYFMLTGFSQGYMGIQAHTEGRSNTVLFSVWSPQETDNPGEVSQDNRVVTLRRGEGVTAQDFGGEGSGGQSFMDYPWQTGKTYKTLVHVRPGGDGTTDYTGYFCDENGQWHLLASFRRPHTDTWYKGAYSFAECFVPEYSIYPREVHFHNQWARLKDGTWQKITSARFSCDNTGRKGFRGDMSGFMEGDDLVLRHCGFIPERTEYGKTFTLAASGVAPQIDFEALENL